MLEGLAAFYNASKILEEEIKKTIVSCECYSICFEMPKMDEQNQSESVYRFKWFMSLTRRRSSKTDEPGKPNYESPENIVNTSGVFFTLRKRLQKKMTSIRIKAYEPECISGISNPTPNDRMTATASNTNNDFARIVIERHSQNPIRFSSPNLPVISSRDTSVTSSVADQNDIRNTANEQHGTLESANIDSMMDQVREDLLKYGWYWGKITRSAAQKRLAWKDNGTFLVRDSETEKDQFAVSFRSSGITLHCRIDYKDNYWSFSGLTTPTQYATMIDLIEDSMRKSEFDVIGFGKQTCPLTPPFPVRLKKPINRFYEVSSLQHMCRFIIRQRINTNDIKHLPLPSKLKDYIEENFFDL